MAELPYRIVIGLEVHVQLLTKTKLFCGCSTRFGLPPNSATCPVCIGMPGVLPVMNRRAFDLSLRAALALNCEIATFTKWDRKNYYYPDLPKNYQISQYDLPFSHDGWLEIDTTAGRKRIGIIRAHLEEDAGKMLHDEHGTGKDSLVDLNRTGTPLLEIVSQPDLSSPEEAKAYLEEIRLLLREIGVSDCEMQEGSLRCDANINIHVPQADGAVIKTPIVEVKNLNSFRAVERAMKYEAQRQYNEALHDSNYRLGQVSKATAGWDENLGETKIQRRKEEASDYRYLPEPDLVPVVVDAAWLERARSAMGELPSVQRVRLVEQYGLSAYDVGVLTQQGRAFVSDFEEVANRCGDSKAACNWMTNKVLASLKEKKEDYQTFRSNSELTPERLAGLIAEQKAASLNKQAAEEVYNRMVNARVDAKTAIGQLGIKAVDAGALVEIVRRAIAANPKAVADFKAGKTKAAQAIKGAVMREAKGAVKPEIVEQLIVEEIQKTS
ncbi:MAG TPA: Asp-tRNA(Asn)/Glu-tRNA(Gln) amidotransferase subunit GatB [Gemmataceae bacterium]|nr:Asp-tRNA(Asn)/Glu-tRNA(Gln) amidotransferase subunit GatB [Gemmataceae bacterium]